MSESDSSNSADFSNISFASEDSDGSFSDAAALCYEFEPEYTEEELKKNQNKATKHLLKVHPLTFYYSFLYVDFFLSKINK